MANKIYVHAETALKFADAAQTPDVQITLADLAGGAARISNQKDLWGQASPVAVAEWYEWRATFQFKVAPTVGHTVDLYLSTSDGTDEDGQEGTSDAAVGSTNSLLNMHYIGSVVVTSADADHDMTASGICRIVARYFCLVVHNNTTQNLDDSTSVNTVMITPVPPEGQ